MSPHPPPDPTTRFWNRPIIPLLCSFTAGIVLALFGPGRAIAALAVAMVCIIFVLQSFFRKQALRHVPLLLFACLGYCAYAACMAGPESINHVAHYIDGRTYRITGAIDGDPLPQSRRTRVVLKDLTLEPVSGACRPFPVKGRLQANIYGKKTGSPPSLFRDSRISFPAEVRPFRSFRNPGGFDYTRYMAWRDIWGGVYAGAHQVRVMGDSAGFFQNRLAIYRDGIRSLVQQAAEGDAAAILAALIIGDRAGVSPGLQEAFNRTGVTHVLSISGLHVGAVAAGAFFLFNRLLAFSTTLLLRAWVRKGAALAAILPVVFYGIMAGMPPATQRSVVMAVAFLLTFPVDREPDPTNTIALAGLTILIISPPTLFAISFQLSFGAVISIAWGIARFEGHIRRSFLGRYSVGRYAATLAAVSLFATAGTAPLVMHYFNILPFAGVLANLVVVPLMGTVVVIMGLFSALVLYPLSDTLALWGFQLANAALQPALTFVKVLSRQPWCAIRTITPSLLEMACFYFLIAGLMLYPRNPTAGTSAPYPTVSKKIAGVMVIAALLVWCADAGYWTWRRVLHKDLRVTVLDVGQGNSAVLEFPGGKRAVIDGGGFSDNTVFDVGERVLAPFLWRNKIQTLDAVILTHPDADHLNGLLFLLKQFRVKQVISTHQAAESAAYREFLSLIEERRIPHPAFKGAAEALGFNNATLHLFHPYIHDGESLGPIPGTDTHDANNASLVIRAAMGDFAFLFPGDIEKAGEKAITAAYGDRLSAPLLMAPHHGSNTSSTQAFLETVHPAAVIISSGKPDRFPSPLVLERYRRFGCRVFRTDENGAIRVVTDGDRTEIIPMKGEGMALE